MATAFALTGLRVAFFRNLNLGQRRSHSPTAPELLDAFARAGVERATNFQTNGTVIFTASGGSEQAREVVRLLGPVCGYSDLVVVRSARWVVELGRRLDALVRVRGPIEGGEVTLFDGGVDPGLPLPWTDPATGLEILALDHRHAVTSWPADAPTGPPTNRVITDMMGVPVTARGVPTMLRLAARLSALG